MNFSLYAIQAVVVLEAENGNRVISRYYQPKSHPHAQSKDFATFRDQRAFEKGLWQKTKKTGGSGDIILYDSHLAVYKSMLDLMVYFIASPAENELMVFSALTSFIDALSLLLRNAIEKRTLLENMDLVLLCLDETIDEGIILDIDSTAIASRVTRPRPDTTEIVINEQTLLSAYQTVKERVTSKLNQL